MANDDFVRAYRAGGIRAVNDLVSTRFGNGGAALVGALERMHDSGDWEIKWHYVHGQADFGTVIAYLGDT